MKLIKSGNYRVFEALCLKHQSLSANDIQRITKLKDPYTPISDLRKLGWKIKQRNGKYYLGANQKPKL